MPSPKRVPLTDETIFYKHVSVENISMLNLKDIEPDPNQPRKQFDESSIKELANSIKEKGLLQPIIVRKTEDKYLVIAGERRYRACKLLGMEKIPCVVKAVNDAKDILEIQIIENMQREDISQIERAKALQEYLSLELNIPKEDVLKTMADFLFGRTEEEEVGEKIKSACTILGKSPKTIYRWLLLLNLPEDVQARIDDPNSTITAKHIEVLSSIKDENLLRQVADIIEKQNLSSSETRELVKELEKKKDKLPQTNIIQPILTSVKKLSKKIPSIEDAEEREQIRNSLLELKELVDKLLDTLSY